jgi:hypothetical protein
MRASGVIPSSRARLSLITITAAAPSFSGQEFPAVTSPSGRNTGFSAASTSAVVPARGQSSTATTCPDGVVTGTILRSKVPLRCDSTARPWDRTANSSISARVTCSASRTFSAVWPIAM